MIIAIKGLIIKKKTQTQTQKKKQTNKQNPKADSDF